MSHQPFIALTDGEWFEFLSARSRDGRLDEVNFWSPTASKPLKDLRPGDPVFFRLKSPHDCIVGYGFFAHFCVLGLHEAWLMFEQKNGDPDLSRFLARIGGYRGVDLVDPRVPHEPLGCTILRDAVFWPSERWLPWGTEEGWAKNIVRGKTETDPARATRLLGEIQHDSMEAPEEFTEEFVPLEVDERELVLAPARERVGQGAFRARLLDAYGRRCAITGEKTEPVLDAAHVQRYLGPRSNHVQNGLLLTQEFHTLFDLGFVTVTPEFRVRVSPALGERWKNGKRYYVHDKEQIRLPDDRRLWPSQRALEWHGKKVFVA
jgi:putative restriction endonuclease